MVHSFSSETMCQNRNDWNSIDFHRGKITTKEGKGCETQSVVIILTSSLIHPCTEPCRHICWSYQYSSHPGKWTGCHCRDSSSSSCCIWPRSCRWTPTKSWSPAAGSPLSPHSLHGNLLSYCYELSIASFPRHTW